MNISVKCPHCGGSASADYVAVSMGRMQCIECGYKTVKGEVRYVTSNPNANLGELLAGLAVVAIGGFALAALFDALGIKSTSQRSGRQPTYDESYLFKFM
jgi:ribosomal protein S27AE